MDFFLSYDSASGLKEVGCLAGTQELTAPSVVDATWLMCPLNLTSASFIWCHQCIGERENSSFPSIVTMLVMTS